jgi:hypothetical protein
MITLFSSKADELLQTVQSQSLEVKELRGEVKDLRGQLEVKSVQIEAQSAQLGAQNIKLEAQTAKLQHQSAKMQDQKSEIAGLRGKVSRLETQVDSLTEDSIKGYKMRIRNFLSYAKAKNITIDRDCLLPLNFLHRLVHGPDSVLDSKAMMELDLLCAEPEMSAFIEVYGLAPHTIIDIRKWIHF